MVNRPEKSVYCDIKTFNVLKWRRKTETTPNEGNFSIKLFQAAPLEITRR